MGKNYPMLLDHLDMDSSPLPNKNAGDFPF